MKVVSLKGVEGKENRKYLKCTRYIFYLKEIKVILRQLLSNRTKLCHIEMSIWEIL